MSIVNVSAEFGRKPQKACVVKFKIVYRRLRQTGAVGEDILPFESFSVQDAEVRLRCGICTAAEYLKSGRSAAFDRTGKQVVFKQRVCFYYHPFGQYPQGVRTAFDGNDFVAEFACFYALPVRNQAYGFSEGNIHLFIAALQKRCNVFVFELWKNA